MGLQAGTGVVDITPREPMFLDPDNAPAYFGTIVRDPSIHTDLLVFQYYVENVSAAGTRTGARASVFFLDEFYDNVFIRLRGQYDPRSQVRVQRWVSLPIRPGAPSRG